MKLFKDLDDALEEKESGEVVVLHSRFGCSLRFGPFPPWAVVCREEIDFNPTHVAWRCPNCGLDTGSAAYSMRQDGSFFD